MYLTRSISTYFSNCSKKYDRKNGLKLTFFEFLSKIVSNKIYNNNIKFAI